MRYKKKDQSPSPMIVSKAVAPRYKTEVRFTKMKSPIQKTAKIVLRFLLNLFSTNSGMVYILFSINMGRKYLRTMSKVMAAIHSYVAIANPMANPEPDMPINCSAEMLAAIK